MQQRTGLLVVLAVPATWLAVTAMQTPGGRNERAIREVAAGRLKEAKASWWGFDPEDSTRALQEAIHSGVPKLIVDNVGKPWIVEPITLASNQEIVFEPGVEVLAKKGSFLGTGDCLLRADLKENITLKGYGATLRMRRSDYAAPPYQKAEWRHCLSFKSCKNVKVYGLTLAESGGDGIYLGTARQGITNKNVLIKDVVCEKNYRQGISVITAEDLLIDNCILRDTGGTPPQAGIDFEPNHPTERLVNCVMRNCVVQNNSGDGYDLYLPPLTAASAPISLRFENCRALGDRGCGVRIVTGNAPDKAVKGSIEFVNCSFEQSGRAGISIARKPAKGCQIRFENCAVLNAAIRGDKEAPIVFASGQGDSEPIGGVEFVRCRVRDPIARRPMAYLDSAGGLGLEGITGTLLIEKEGTTQEVPLTKERLAEWLPVTAMKRYPRLQVKGLSLKPVAQAREARVVAPDFVRLRGSGRLLLYAPQGEQVRLRLAHLRVGSYSGTTIPVSVVAPSGSEVKKADLPFEKEAEVAFVAPETGVYRVSLAPGSNQVRILSCTHPLNLDGSDEPIHLIQTVGDLFFWVPAGIKEFGVRVCGEGSGEAVKATLIDPKGRVVGEVDNQTTLHQFEITLLQPSQGEAWCLRLSRPSQIVMEDHYVDLRGIPPLLAPSREWLLAPMN